MAEQLRYVFLTKLGHNVLGEKKSVKDPSGIGTTDLWVPRLDDLIMKEGWTPVKEVVVGDHVLILLSKS
jgi:hypothetical protein